MTLVSLKISFIPKRNSTSEAKLQSTTDTENHKKFV